MKSSMLRCAWFALVVSACAEQTGAPPDTDTDDASAGSLGESHGGAGNMTGGFSVAGKANGSAGRASAGSAGKAELGDGGGGAGSGSGSSAGRAGGGGSGQGGSAQGGQSGAAQAGQTSATAGSAGAPSSTCAPHVFAYADQAHLLKSVAVTGSFDAWSTTGMPLSYDTGSKSWQLPMTLAVGRHQYKFIVDGSSAWQPDPANPKTMSDGFGGMNSLLDCT